MSDTAARNKVLVADAFAHWEAGCGTVFDLLADDATWTIAGSRDPAGTYHGRAAYVAAAVTPLMDRLAEPVRPQSLSLLADGDTVVARWSQATPLKAGGQYRTDYAWFLPIKAGRIVRATAFLDLDEYNRAVGRPLANPA